MAVASWPAAKPIAAAASITMTARDTGHGRASNAAITAGTATDAPTHTGGSERRAKYSSTPAPRSTGSQSTKRPRSACLPRLQRILVNYLLHAREVNDAASTAGECACYCMGASAYDGFRRHVQPIEGEARPVKSLAG